jgi:hypothetical protein
MLDFASAGAATNGAVLVSAYHADRHDVASCVPS